MGFESELKIKNEDADIRKISAKEVEKYASKVKMCVFMYIPLLILIWIVPFVPHLDSIMLGINLWRGNTLYVLICLVFASII